MSIQILALFRNLHKIINIFFPIDKNVVFASFGYILLFFLSFDLKMDKTDEFLISASRSLHNLIVDGIKLL